MRNLRKALGLLSLCIVVSCTPKIKDFHSYSKRPILKSKFVTKQDFKKSKASVVVLNFNNRESKLAREANLGNALAISTENYLAENKLVKLLDRNAFKQLEKEIALNELGGSGNYKGPVAADYAVSGDVITSSYNHEFVDASVGYDPVNKRILRSPARNKYNSNFAGNIKIYKLPSLEVVDVLPLKGAAKRSEDAVVNRSWWSSKVDTSTIVKNDKALIRKAAISALKKQQHNLKNIFSSMRKGYIIEKRTKGKKNIFKITLGSDSGIEHGQKVTIYSKEKVINPITETSSIERITLGQAIVGDRINSGYAWIIVKDPALAAKIRIGDFITVLFKKRFSLPEL